MMWGRKENNNRGVAPVIGIAILLVIVVLLAGVVFLGVFGAVNLSESPPQMDVTTSAKSITLDGEKHTNACFRVNAGDTASLNNKEIQISLPEQDKQVTVTNLPQPSGNIEDATISGDTEILTTKDGSLTGQYAQPNGELSAGKQSCIALSNNIYIPTGETLKIGFITTTGSGDSFFIFDTETIITPEESGLGYENLPAEISNPYAETLYLTGGSDSTVTKYNRSGGSGPVWVWEHPDKGTSYCQTWGCDVNGVGQGMSEDIYVTVEQPGVVFKIDHENKNTVWERNLSETKLYDSTARANGIYVAGDNGYLAFLGGSGSLQWEKNVDGTSVYAIGAGNNAVYAGTEGGEFHKYTDSGNTIFSTTLSSEPLRDAEAEPGFNYAFAAGDDGLWRVDATTGGTDWKSLSGRTIIDAEVTTDGSEYVYALENDGTIHKLNRNDGSKVSTDDWPITVSGATCLEHGLANELYVGTDTGEVLRLSQDGNIHWETNMGTGATDCTTVQQY